MKGYATGRVLFVAVVALVLELTALDAFAWGGARPELLLTMTCFAALWARDPEQGHVACWSLGLIKDVASAGPFGWHALLYLLLGATLVRLRPLLFRDHVAWQCAMGAVLAALAGLATAIWVCATQGGLPAGVFIGRLLASIVLTALVAPFFLTWLSGARFLRA